MSRKKSPKAAPLQRWRIIEIRKKGQTIATVGAPDADAAIQIAIKEYDITDPQRQRRLVAQLITDS